MRFIAPKSPVAGRRATRLDPVSRVSEDAAFIKAGEDELFCMVHRPASTPRGGVVICCSILAEHLLLYGPEVLAARAMAARGFAVIRFHYRGTGHSGGLTEAATLDSMLEDTFVAADFLADATGVRSIAFCGARWGAIVAGLAACQRPNTPLAMWEPAIDRDRYLGEIARAQQMVALVNGSSSRVTVGEMQQEMRTAGYTDVLGYAMHLRLYESAAGRSLAELADGPPRPVLLIQASNRSQLKPEFAELMDACRRNGSRVESVLLKANVAWSWEIPGQSAEALSHNTVGWLGRLDGAA